MFYRRQVDSQGVTLKRQPCNCLLGMNVKYLNLAVRVPQLPAIM
ncbi:hypothetical protein CapIbe_007237, partial [Capra ibex]